MSEFGGYGYSLQQNSFTPGSTPVVKINLSLANEVPPQTWGEDGGLELTKEQQAVVYATGGGGSGSGSIGTIACMKYLIMMRAAYNVWLSAKGRLSRAQADYQNCLTACGNGKTCPECADCQYPCVAWCLKGGKTLCPDFAQGFPICYQCETYLKDPNHPSVLAWKEYCFRSPGSPFTCQSDTECVTKCDTTWKTKIEQLKNEVDTLWKKYQSLVEVAVECIRLGGVGIDAG